MNHLAHAFLAQNKPDWIIGNIVADFCNNREVAQLPMSIQQGVYIHRQIDMFTDNHREVLKGVERIRPFHHKYSPVVTDVYYDYLLIKNWKKFSDERVQDFVDDVYAVLEAKMNIMPSKLKEKLPTMIAHNWLLSTATEKRLQFTFEKIELRTKFDSHLELATSLLFEHIDEFEQEFLKFFPEIQLFIKEYCSEL